MEVHLRHATDRCAVGWLLQEDGRLAIHMAAVNGHTTALAMLLLDDRVDVMARHVRDIVGMQQHVS